MALALVASIAWVGIAWIGNNLFASDLFGSKLICKGSGTVG